MIKFRQNTTNFSMIKSCQNTSNFTMLIKSCQNTSNFTMLKSCQNTSNFVMLKSCQNTSKFRKWRQRTRPRTTTKSFLRPLHFVTCGQKQQSYSWLNIGYLPMELLYLPNLPELCVILWCVSLILDKYSQYELCQRSLDGHIQRAYDFYAIWSTLVRLCIFR